MPWNWQKTLRRVIAQKKKKKSDNKRLKKIERCSAGKYTAKLLYGWGNKKYDKEYWKRMEENWRQQKKNPFSRYNKNPFLKKIEKEKEEYKREKIEEQDKEEDEED